MSNLQVAYIMGNRTVAHYCGRPTLPVIPTVIESDGRVERAFDIYSRLLRDRIVFLGREVDDEIANLIVAQFLLLEADDPERDIAST